MQIPLLFIKHNYSVVCSIYIDFKFPKFDTAFLKERSISLIYPHFGHLISIFPVVIVTLTGGFQEFNIFDMRENRMEYEANIFAAQASLPDDTIIEYIKDGYDIQQIAKAMHSDINLIALKVDTLNSQGYQFRKQEHRNDFLKYTKQM